MVTSRCRKGVTADASIEVLLGDRTYFIDRDGTRWRVYDLVDAEGRLQVHRPPHRLATSRAFVTASGARRLYRFHDGATRVLSVTALEHQLQAATITRAALPKRPGWAEQRLRDDE
jgi:hypothetical protein